MNALVFGNFRFRRHRANRVRRHIASLCSRGDTLAMTKRAPIHNPKFTFAVTLRILEVPSRKGQSESLLLSCELRPDSKFGVASFLSTIIYDELAREKIEYRIDYISQHLDDALTPAIVKLWNDSGKATERAKQSFKDEADARRALKEWRRRDKKEVLGDEGYMPISHGGARQKETTPPNTDEDCKKFAREIDYVHETWKSITRFFLEQGFTSDTIAAIKGKDYFKLLNKDHPVPDDLLRQVFKRKSSNAREYRPQGLAMKHIHREMFPENETPSYGTLRDRYLKGRQLNRTRSRVAS